MKSVFGVLSVLAVAALTTALPFLLPHAIWPTTTHVSFELCTAAVAVGAWRGAAAFDRGDRMRVAWLWIASSGLIGCLAGLTGPPPLRSLQQAMPLSTSALVFHIVVDIALNVTVIAGLFIFARALSATGLAPPWQRTATLVAVVLGLAVAGPALWHELNVLLGGSWENVSDAISSIGDITAISLAGPLFASALWMRGGALVGPFVYLTCYSLSWLIYDASGHLPHGPIADACDLFFCNAGNLFSAFAGVTHSNAIRKRA